MKTRTNEIIDQNVDYKAECSRLKRERDEAREELEIARLQRDEAVVDHQRVFKERETARGEADRYFKERDEAQEKYFAMRDLSNNATELAEKYKRQRDEAREDAAHWKTEYEIVAARLCGKKHPRDNGIISEHEIIPKLTQERDELLAYLDAARYATCNAELRRERDEAREDLKITQEAWVKAKAERVKALRERDEAFLRVFDKWEE